jgi:hypothetical protein
MFHGHKRPKTLAGVKVSAISNDDYYQLATCLRTGVLTEPCKEGLGGGGGGEDSTCGTSGRNLHNLTTLRHTVEVNQASISNWDIAL